jgi:hypothetical protein
MIINIQDTGHFFDFIADNVDGDYRYKYLNNVLTGIINQEIEVGINSFVYETAGGWLIFIEVKDHLFVYGNNYSNVHIAHFFETIDLKKYQDSEIMGTHDLVYTLLNNLK